MKKHLLICTLLSSCILCFNCSNFKEVTPNYPKKVNRLIKESIQHSDASSYYLGKVDTIISDGFKIAFESVGDKKNSSILLINGFRAPASTWSPDFVLGLVEEGYHVVKIDNRDVGLSCNLSSKKKQIYTLQDMANDGVLVMDKLGIGNFHVVGSSMGGMIAQTMAIDYPDRVASLISISSTGYLHDSELKHLTFNTAMKAGIIFIKYGVNDRNIKQAVKRRIEAESYLRGDEDITQEWIEDVVQKFVYEKERGASINRKAIKRHRKAIKLSGSRLEELHTIISPVLVIHGKKDPLILPEHAKKYADLLPNKKLIIVDDLGHVPSKEQEQLLSGYIVDFLANK
jgi:pimeloyl-ACP methyl ester carboxylesterase